MMPIDDLKDTSQNKCNSQDICQCEVFANGSATRPNQYRLCKRFWRSAGLRKLAETTATCTGPKVGITAKRQAARRNDTEKMA